jgi:hypothetical protein
METSEHIGAIAGALAKAHLKIENPELDGQNPHYKSRFSTLAAVLNAVRKPLAEQGIALLQSVALEDGKVRVTTNLVHSSGEWMRETMAFPLQGSATVQQAGSTVTYLRRYSLISLCGIVGDPQQDDDGEADAEAREEHKPVRASQPPRKEVKQERPRRVEQASPSEEVKPEAVPAKTDKFPDDGEFLVTIKRVVRRQGRKTAVQVESVEHGLCWVSTMVEGYADFLAERVDEQMTLGLQRQGVALELTHIRSAAAAATKQPVVETDKEDLPF